MPQTHDLIAEAIDLGAIQERLRPQSSEKLKIRFLECYNGAANLIAEAAVCVKLLEERGKEEIRGLPMIGTFRKIASGQILPELLWQFIESKALPFVERLPLPDQKRLVADSMFPVVEPKPGGGYTTRKVDLRQAPPEVAKLAVGPDGLRSPEEQAVYLNTQKIRMTARPAVAPMTVEEPLIHKLTIRVTPSELQSLRHLAADAGVSDAEMVRSLLVKVGAFKRPKG